MKRALVFHLVGATKGESGSSLSVIGVLKERWVRELELTSKFVNSMLATICVRATKRVTSDAYDSSLRA